MPIGAHLPTSKGFEAALQNAQSLDCGCLQIFSKSPRQWNAAPLDEAKVKAFRTAWDKSKLSPLIVHDSYLINLAAPDKAVREKSIKAMIDEVERAEALGADYLVTHGGSHLAKDSEDGEAIGLKNLADSLREVISQSPNAKVRIALENTAAQGTSLGGPFEHLGRVLKDVKSDRLRVCFDTCHAFAAGHPFATAAQVESTLKEFDRIVGFKELAVIHLNDSKGECGKHLDRHEHIGQGKIGRAAMKAILNHPKLQKVAIILETPEVETMVETNLNMIRELRAK